MAYISVDAKSNTPLYSGWNLNHGNMFSNVVFKPRTKYNHVNEVPF